jgi:K+-sensing histidine kinase KdpD
MRSLLAGRDRLAVLAGLVAPLVVAVILVPFRDGFPGTDAALVLIVVVVAVGAAGYQPAGVVAAVSAAAWFDFFLTVPYERFTITRRVSAPLWAETPSGRVCVVASTLGTGGSPENAASTPVLGGVFPRIRGMCR